MPYQKFTPAIVTIPDPILTKATFDVEHGEPTTDLISNLFLVMKEAGAIGLAAPQIGIAKRVAIVKVEGDPAIIMVNPTIISSSGAEIKDEGCLSIPGVRLPIRRATTISLKQGGVEGLRVFTGLTARAIQHEVDHLDGILMTDRARELILDLAESWG